MITAEVEIIPFKLSSRPIEYKKLQPGHFVWAKPDTLYEHIQPDEKGYVSDQLFKSLHKDFEKSNTCIINIGVGRGKSTTAYHIIDHYAKQKDYIVVLASPFKKLVQRDYVEVSKRAEAGLYRVVNYEILENEEIALHEIASAKVHITTINSLMFNPGEENVQITWRKRNYCEAIKEYCREHKKKVVFVFDEIHAGIHCFQEEYIFNLRAWKDITHKCFVLSATYTEPAKVAIEYIAYLTDYRLHIIETERRKFPEQSNLHLYITDGKYSARDLSLLDPLKYIVQSAVKDKKRVHIITAFKELAEKLVDTKETTNDLIQSILDLDPNLVTGMSEVDFNAQASNIGTTFYTGIDLTQEDDILVLIMPSAESQFSDKIGGIFTTGKVAIVQAIARLRGRGDIYLFMPKSELLFIEGDYVEKVDNRVLGEKGEPPVEDERQFAILSDFYNAQRELIKDELAKAKAEVAGHNWDDRASLTYPSLSSFILNKGMHYLIERYASYGRGFSPYVLWAALNDQFENTTLKSIYYVLHTTEKLELYRENLDRQLIVYYGDWEGVMQLIKGKSFIDAYNTLVSLLAYKRQSDAVYGRKVSLWLDGKNFEFAKTPVVIKQSILNILHRAALGHHEVVDASLWIRSQIAKYQNKKNKRLDKDPLKEWYRRLEETRKEFCKRVTRNKMVASPELLDADFLYECVEVIRKINELDKFLRNRTLTFCRLLPEEADEKKLTKAQVQKEGKGITTLRNKVYQSYKSTFTEFKFEKKGTAKIDSFKALPDAHFFPEVYKEPAQEILRKKNRRDLERRFRPSKGNLSTMTIDQLREECELNNQALLYAIQNDLDITMEEFEKLILPIVVRQRALQRVLGIVEPGSDEKELVVKLSGFKW